MRIAIIHTLLTHPGGGEKQALRLAVELVRQGHKVEIFTNALDRSRCFPELLRQVKVNVIPPQRNLVSRILSSIGHRLGMAGTLGRLEILSIAGGIPRGEFDIINCHNYSSNWAAWLAKKRINTPVVWMCNEPPPWYYQAGARKASTFLFEFIFLNIFDKYTVKAVDKIVVLSENFAALVEKIYNRHAILVRSGVDSEVFKKGNGDALRKELGLDDKFVLLHVGSASSFKNDFCPLLALESLANKYASLRMVFVGNNTKEFFGPEAGRLGLSEKVFFYNEIGEGALLDFYSACDVFLFPVDQSWGLAAVEAMAAGKPIIVSEKTGVSEVIEDRVTGMVVGHGQPQQIADCVEKLINTPALRAQIGVNARKFVKNNLSWEKYSSEMLNIFEQTIREYRAR